jgi:alcohol dehydrogenase class IV
MSSSFRWRDGERLIVFGRDSLGQARALLGDGYTLLTTRRARQTAPELASAAGAVHEVPAGRVDELAGQLRPAVRGELLVALGGGRVIDVAKALAAADPPRRVAAVPSTLAGAEMTAIHRHAAGVDPATPRVRPTLVINDPTLSASQPWRELTCSAANALGHAAEGPLTTLTNPVARLAGLEAARQLARGLRAGEASASGRDALALGALLAGYVIGSTGYGLHHVLCQTLARLTPVGHGAANALMLPVSLTALRHRDDGRYLDALGEALGEEPVTFAGWLRQVAGLGRLRALGVVERDLERCAEEAAGRPELKMTPPPASREEVLELYQAAR